MHPSQYPHKKPPYTHQQETLTSTWDLPAHALFLEMGTGKSKLSLDTWGMLALNDLSSVLVIVCPKSLVLTWAYEQIPDHLPDEILEQTDVTYWQPSLEPLSLEEVYHQRYTILIVNVESLRVKTSKMKESRALTYIRQFMQWAQNSATMMIVDESTTIKNPDAKRTKAVNRELRPFTTYRRILSGLPAPNGPLDLYSQFEFLDPSFLQQRSFYTFKARYAVMEKMRVAGGREFNHVVGFQRIEELNALVAQHATIIRKEDCLDLPEKVYKTILLEMSARQKKIYAEMRKNAYIALADGEEVTAPIVLTQLLRLQQVSSGYLSTDTGNLYPIDTPDKAPRLQALKEILEHLPEDERVLIWCQFTPELDLVCDMLKNTFDSDSYVMYYGQRTITERQAAIEQFRDDTAAPRFFVGQPKAGGRGLTLIEATTVVYYSNSYDLDLRSQSEDRTHRIGQTKSVLYIDLIMADTVDEKVVKALRKKENLAEQILRKQIDF
jgi:SNF2 family DNA or RNA helicase